MNKIIQHIPGCVSTGEPKKTKFLDTDELLNIDWVKKWTFMKSKKFYRWSKNNKLLIAEYENGEKWWVVGYIEKPDEINLPQWRK